jgi:hypothetical protein
MGGRCGILGHWPFPSLAGLDTNPPYIERTGIFGKTPTGRYTSGQDELWFLPPRVDHLDVVGRLTPSIMETRLQPGGAVALGRVLVLT